MCCSNGATTTQTTTPATSSTDAFNSLLGQAAGAAAIPYQAYTGQRVAPLTDAQNTGIAATTGAAAGAQPALQTAAAEATQAGTPVAQPGTFDASQQAKYSDPYTKSVIDSTNANLERTSQINQQGIAANAASAGAFGGDRATVASQEQAKNDALNEATVDSQLNQADFNQGETQFNTEQNRALATGVANAGIANAAAGTNANLGATEQGLGIAAGTADINAGAVQQNENQQNLTTAYNDFVQQRDYPKTQVNFESGVYHGINPSALGPTTTTTTAPPPSTASTLAGLGTAGLGIGALASSGALSGVGDFISNIFNADGGLVELADGGIAAGPVDGAGPIDQYRASMDPAYREAMMPSDRAEARTIAPAYAAGGIADAYETGPGSTAYWTQAFGGPDYTGGTLPYGAPQDVRPIAPIGYGGIEAPIPAGGPIRDLDPSADDMMTARLNAATQSGDLGGPEPSSAPQGPPNYLAPGRTVPLAPLSADSQIQAREEEPRGIAAQPGPVDASGPIDLQRAAMDPRYREAIMPSATDQARSYAPSPTDPTGAPLPVSQMSLPEQDPAAAEALTTGEPLDQVRARYAAAEADRQAALQAQQPQAGGAQAADQGIAAGPPDDSEMQSHAGSEAAQGQTRMADIDQWAGDQVLRDRALATKPEAPLPTGGIAAPDLSAPTQTARPQTGSEDPAVAGGAAATTTQRAERAQPTTDDGTPVPTPGTGQRLEGIAAGPTGTTPTPDRAAQDRAYQAATGNPPPAANDPNRRQKIDFALSLLSAGGGMLARGSPFFGVNVGAGIEAGVHTLQTSEANRYANELRKAQIDSNAIYHQALARSAARKGDAAVENAGTRASVAPSVIAKNQGAADLSGVRAAEAPKVTAIRQQNANSASATAGANVSRAATQATAEGNIQHGRPMTDNQLLTHWQAGDDAKKGPDGKKESFESYVARHRPGGATVPAAGADPNIGKASRHPIGTPSPDGNYIVGPNGTWQKKAA